MSVYLEVDDASALAVHRDIWLIHMKYLVLETCVPAPDCDDERMAAVGELPGTPLFEVKP